MLSNEHRVYILIQTDRIDMHTITIVIPTSSVSSPDRTHTLTLSERTQGNGSSIRCTVYAVGAVVVVIMA